jgi:regulator of protease activity HflC (stomatin/prohibitin superfamily)
MAWIIGILLLLITGALFTWGLFIGDAIGRLHLSYNPSEQEQLQYKKDKKILRNKRKFAFIGAIVALVAFVIVPFSFHQVDTGEIAVVKQYGKVVDTRTAGLNFDLWFIRTYEKYDLKTQETTQEIAAYSSDAQTMTGTLTIQYKIKADKVLEINETYGSLSVLSERISSVAVEKAKVVLSSQSAMQIIENRGTLSQRLNDEITSAMQGYNVDITLAVITNIDFSDAFEKVVEDKMIAEQEKMKAEYEKEKAIIQAEQQLEVAKKQAEAELAKAEGEAKAQIEIAKAQAETIKSKSLEIARMLGFEIVDGEIIMDGKSPEQIAAISEYLKYITYLETWDGKLPETMVGDSSNVIVGLK